MGSAWSSDCVKDPPAERKTCENDLNFRQVHSTLATVSLRHPIWTLPIHPTAFIPKEKKQLSGFLAPVSLIDGRKRGHCFARTHQVYVIAMVKHRAELAMRGKKWGRNIIFPFGFSV